MPGIGGDGLLQDQTQVEARALPIDPNNRVAVDFARQLLTIAGCGDGDDGVGVGVIDMAERDEGVQRRID